MKEKCKYCDFKLQEKPFGKDKALRGEFLLDDCDVSIYLEKEDCGEYGTEYSIVSDSYDSYDGEAEIKYCPMCGRKLVK